MNWNSTTTVKNKILNNRGVDGDKVYTKTPLYTFKLDAKVIKNGRGPKLIVFKYKAKNNDAKKRGHRQPYTKLVIEKINY